jgi:hypothetical protein
MTRALLAGAVALGACGDGGSSGPPDVYFDLGSTHDAFDTFWDQPFPSDLRMTATGELDLEGYPNVRDVPIANDLLVVARQHRAATMMPITYVRFGAEVPELRHTDVIPPSATEDVFLVELASATLVPVVAETLVQDDFAPPTLVAIAPRPGFVLAPETTYAAVVRRSFAPDADVPRDFVEIERHPDAASVYEPLWPALDALGVARDDVLVASVFTTGDETRLLHDRSEAVRAAHDAVIANLAIDPTDGGAHDGFCELIGTLTVPQFQVGTPPFNDEGMFEYESDGTPIRQATMTVPVTITLPFGEMPARGWPLFLYFHGSGGASLDLADRGKTLTSGGDPTVGEGPGFVLAKHGIAAAASSLPLNPERLAGASDYEYVNINNLSAMPFTFQQGVFEQRLFLDALLELSIAPGEVCPEVTLPGGETVHHFDPDTLTAGGQSMGGMYSNMVGSVDPRPGAFVPTGAGGMWNYMILDSTLIPGARELLVAAFSTDFERFNFMHPALNILAMGWEIAEPVMYMARIARSPLDEPGFAPRPVYEPVGEPDPYFSSAVYDAAALAYGNHQAGTEVWPTMQDALALDGLDGLRAYPISANTPAGTTGVVTQWAGDGIVSAHNVAYQYDEVKHQYGCFLETYVATGTPVVVAPGAIGPPCD